MAKYTRYDPQNRKNGQHKKNDRETRIHEVRSKEKFNEKEAIERYYSGESMEFDEEMNY